MQAEPIRLGKALEEWTDTTIQSLSVADLEIACSALALDIGQLRRAIDVEIRRRRGEMRGAA